MATVNAKFSMHFIATSVSSFSVLFLSTCGLGGYNPSRIHLRTNGAPHGKQRHDITSVFAARLVHRGPLARVRRRGAGQSSAAYRTDAFLRSGVNQLLWVER